ncbi:glycerophosphoryl diester phosphodiesterase membrane domain-containing protein [Streptomyces roseolus]|uniref:proline-rich domain-containing protein n=1 Tax=Streptomyces roseolus TaxID=67358 RepID=UPI0036544E4B
MNDTPGRNTPGSAPSDDQDGSAIPGQPSAPEPDGSGPQWSKDQPPAGRWSPPPGGPNRPQAPGRAWGNPPPQRGWGGYGAPAAPKPGVIPLRPLGVGEILDAAVQTLRRYWRTVLAVTVPVAVVTQVALVFVQRYLSAELPDLHADATPTEQLEAASAYLRASATELAPTMLVSVAASVFTSALLTIVVSRAILGRPVTVSEAWREASPRLPQLLVLSLALPLGAGALAFVAMLPGLLLGGAGGATLAFLGGTAAFVAIVWLLIRFGLASPALMLERQGIVAALKRSAKLVDGSWWRVFGYTLVMLLIVGGVSFAVQMVISVATQASVFGAPLAQHATPGTVFASVATMAITGGLLQFLTQLVLGPLLPLASGLLYVDQRIRREALDLELTKAAAGTDD